MRIRVETHSHNGIGTFQQVNWLRFVKSGIACGRLFGLFWPLTIAQSHTRPAAVFVDEFDACGFAHAARGRPLAQFADAALDQQFLSRNATAD